MQHDFKSPPRPKALVTGVAGFIGSHLAERLLSDGYDVLGVDCFTDYYARSLKESNLQVLCATPGFELIEADLVNADLPRLLRGVRFVFHQAGQPGVRASWGSSFQSYTADNIEATQRLLEAAKEYGGLDKFVYASSSSVYGKTADLPMRETSRPQPFSPYGVTKLAAEHLCLLYSMNFGLPVMCLRYFTVFGPRQRPDMAFNKFISAMLDDAPLTVYDDGNQTRDFTYVSDVIEANVLAALCPHAGEVCNVAGGVHGSVNGVIELLRDLTGSRSPVVYEPPQSGDPQHTAADTSRARQLFDYNPTVSKEEGLAREVEWLERTLARPVRG